MGTSNYSDEFKRDAVQQITVRGYPVREVARRLGVSSHSLYKWLKLFGAGGSLPAASDRCSSAKQKLEASMSSRGNCHNNAVAESFF
jgi:transposase